IIGLVSGGLFHGVQLWVNLPGRSKMIPPRYQNLDAGSVTLLSSPDGGALIRLISGEIDGHRGPGSTHTPILVAHATLAPGARLAVPWNTEFNALVYGLDGRGSVGLECHDLGLGQLAVFGVGDTVVLQAHESSALDVLLLGGRPLREPVVAHGPFVMNTRDEIRQAFEDFQSGRLGVVPPDGIRPYRL
ncbi:MAG: pirin family protein, partial [Ilumatobacteraceae bacterium]